MKKQLEPQLVRLPISILNVDRYQKRIRESKVKNIVENFDQSKLGVIHVSMRNDGSHWIFDGQHRVEALRRLGWEFVLCLVFQNMKYEEEASAFVGHHDSSRPTKLEEHYARLEAQDPVALEIQAILDSLDIEAANGRYKNKITFHSIGTVYEVFEKNGGSKLFEVLFIIKESFEGDPSSFNMNMIKGIRDVLVDYDTKVDKKWLVKNLRKTTSNNINIKANGIRDVYGFSKRESQKMAIIQQYNHRKSEHLKLK